MGKSGKKWGGSIFSGTYRYVLDEKGRLSIPSRFRTVLSERYRDGRILLTQYPEFCLIAYPFAELSALADRIRALPTMKKELRDFRRELFSKAVECSPDRQGRILISPELREYAGLNGEVVVIGVENTFEIWDTRRWSEKEHLISQNSERIVETLAELGL